MITRFENFNNQNEGLKTNIAAITFISSLLMGSPQLSKAIENPRALINQTNVITKDNKNIDDIELRNILKDIKSNLKNDNQQKYIELYKKLINHMKDKYGYEIRKEDIEDINIKDIEKAKDDNDIWKLIGWLGAICFAACGAPQAWESFKSKNSDGLTWGMLILWMLGELLTTVYVASKQTSLDYPLLTNYAFNIALVGIMIYYKKYPGGYKKKEEITE